MAELEEPVNNEKDPGAKDPFDPDNVGAFQLIATMRLYDVMMALYRHHNKEAAVRLEEIHSQGKTLASFPWLDLTEGGSDGS